MLDTTTIYITTFLVYICMACILGVIWKYYSAGYKGVGLWVLGIGTGIFGFCLVAVREFIPLSLSVVGGITLLPIGLAFIIVGLERFFHLAATTRLQVFFILAIFVWQCIFLFAVDHVYARIAGFSMISAFQIFYGAYRLLFHLEPQYRPMARLTAFVLVIMGLIFAERVFFAIPNLGSLSEMATFDPTRSIFLFFLLILSVFLVFSLVVMLFRRQTMALEEKSLELEHHQASLENVVWEKSVRLAEAEKLASIGILASGVGHEISNPNQVISHNLATVSKFLSMIMPLVDKKQLQFSSSEKSAPVNLAPRVIKGVEQAREASGRISGIISGLRDFSQSDEEESPGTHDLRDIINSAVSFCDHYLRKRTMYFKLDLPETHLDCFCHAHRMEQVIINLLKNSADSLISKSGSITLSAGKSDRAVFIRVADTGAGIEPGNLSKLTTPFYTTHREKGGTGLGLYLAARIIEGYNGSLNISSEPGKGTVVEVVLPIKIQDANR